MRYKKPWYLFNGHLETIIPYLRYKIYQVPYERERLELDDGDFLDLDWVKNGNPRLLVISHALEGNSRDYFIERTAKYFSSRGYDILMWHFRSCSKELNRLPKLYSLKDTEDLDAVVNHGLKSGSYENVFLMGFSMGGVTTANYLTSEIYSPHIDAAIVISTPFDLAETVTKLETGVNNLLYARNFKDKIKRKLIKKAKQFPNHWDLHAVLKSDSLRSLLKLQFGEATTESYLKEVSPLKQLHKLQVPLLVLNAKNDPLLGGNSYPNGGEYLTYQYPNTGGHAGFMIKRADYSLVEIMVEEFLNQLN